LIAANGFGFTGGDFSELRGVERSKVFASLGLLGRTSLGLTSETEGNDADGTRECFVGVEGGSFAKNADTGDFTEPTGALEADGFSMSSLVSFDVVPCDAAIVEGTASGPDTSVVGPPTCLVGARLFGPFALPFVLCSSGSVDDGGVSTAADLEACPEAALVPLGFDPGGPRDNTPSNAGLKRSASLLETPGFAIPGSAKACGFGSALLDCNVG
jgi:hypothetical protein